MPRAENHLSEVAAQTQGFSFDPDPELSVVIPCLNESDTLKSGWRKAREAMEQTEIHGEIVVADNGSSVR